MVRTGGERCSKLYGYINEERKWCYLFSINRYVYDKESDIIYVDVIRFNLFGAIKRQIEKDGNVEILWGIDKEYLQTANEGQEVYFYLTGTKKRTELPMQNIIFWNYLHLKGLSQRLQSRSRRMVNFGVQRRMQRKICLLKSMQE